MTLVKLAGRDAYCLLQDARVVVRILRPRNGAVRASLAGREWRLLVRNVRGGWMGLAEDQRSGDQVAAYRSGLIWGGKLTLEGRKHQLRRGLSGAWRLRTRGTNLAVMRVGNLGAEIELTLGIRQVGDPLLLVVMIVWASWLEEELSGL